MAEPGEDARLTLGSTLLGSPGIKPVDVYDSQQRKKSGYTMKPPVFYGEEGKGEFDSITAFVRQYEAIAEVFDWNERDKLRYLFPNTRGAAQRFLATLREEVETDGDSLTYDHAIRELRAEFGATEKPRLMRAFNGCVQEAREPLEQYVQRFLAIYDQVRAYVLADYALERFQLGVRDPALRTYLFLNEPATLGQATRLAKRAAYCQAMGSVYLGTPPRADGAKASRGTGEATTGKEGDRAKEKMGERPKWSDVVCFNCRDKGHFAKECTRPYKPREAGAPVRSVTQTEAAPRWAQWDPASNSWTEVEVVSHESGNEWGSA